MKEVIGVRFRTNGRIYYFDPKDREVSVGTKVVVETTKGIEFGWVVTARHEVDETRIQGGLRPIQRLATEQDIARYEENKEKARKAYEICIKKIREHDLKMKLISAECAFDNNKMMFYFTADGRVDFRELVKDLASVFRTRIELRQVGVRDEARICGGIGMCGRELCCHSYLSDFIPVSIKMAKEQSLSLNPTKISGVCGRLMCCLKHEQDTYEYLNSKLPNVGDRVTAYDGVTGDVASLNVLRQKVKIYVTDEEGNKEIVEYRVEELVSGPRGRKFDTDLSLLDPELSLLEDDAEQPEEAPPQEHRRRERPEGERGGKNRSGRDGGQNDRGKDREKDRDKDRERNRGDRRDREKDRKENPQKENSGRRQGQDNTEKGRPDGERRDRSRNPKDRQDHNKGKDGGKKQGGHPNQGAAPNQGNAANSNSNGEANQNPKFHRRNHRPNRKPENKQ